MNDLSGKRFGRLLVLKFRFIMHKNSHWLCLCDCGNKITTSRVNLIQGFTRSCGCYRRELSRSEGRILRFKNCNTKHGETKNYTVTTEYNAWIGIKERCTNPKNHAFPNYGGRGITVCDRWMHSFDNFLADMGRKPTPIHSMDRIDNNGNYTPSNCRWATKKQQALNRRPRREKHV